MELHVKNFIQIPQNPLTLTHPNPLICSPFGLELVSFLHSWPQSNILLKNILRWFPKNCSNSHMFWSKIYIVFCPFFGQTLGIFGRQDMATNKWIKGWKQPWLQMIGLGDVTLKRFWGIILNANAADVEWDDVVCVLVYGWAWQVWVPWSRIWMLTVFHGQILVLPLAFVYLFI